VDTGATLVTKDNVGDFIKAREASKSEKK
jgi:hypothetical protein